VPHPQRCASTLHMRPRNDSVGIGRPDVERTHIPQRVLDPA
jgi:hypothetical protein